MRVCVCVCVRVRENMTHINFPLGHKGRITPTQRTLLNFISFKKCNFLRLIKTDKKEERKKQERKKKEKVYDPKEKEGQTYFNVCCTKIHE